MLSFYAMSKDKSVRADQTDAWEGGEGWVCEPHCTEILHLSLVPQSWENFFLGMRRKEPFQLTQRKGDVLDLL